ncbi:hypothetical protein Asulf_01549 [Archaeoglobus sulfaticallidus PM70-1]|uniref:DUF473 domain-containing protein n=1 Tax=Archaeoglobus sulfaticallidus PM70-1 TaxID=387631 RepID=N0BLV8_9EURY|nr:DUF473 domain-containing protein [Archaeoglobus sulfaticallidus]AGK61526.1 hypothetical protein Asulf_01549 [Archaeoglobus sulfaticallidus PM70-1]
MRCFVFTGISRVIIEDVIKGMVKTIELRSAHNVATALKANVGNCVFLTPTRLYDLSRGVSGLVAEVTGKEVISHSIFLSTDRFMDESEMTVVKLRLKPKCIGRILNVLNAGILDSTEAEVIEMSYYDAK